MMANNTQQLRDAILHEIPRTRCNDGCDGKGTYGEYDSDGEPQAAQCQYCWQVRIPQSQRIIYLIEAECTRREQAARIDELRLFMSRTASVQTGQSWDVWDKRVTDNINTRIAELKERKES